jgi:hypothetical protein
MFIASEIMFLVCCDGFYQILVQSFISNTSCIYYVIIFFLNLNKLSDCYVTPNEPFFSHIMVRTSYIQWNDDEFRFLQNQHAELDIGWLSIRIMSPTGTPCLPAACYFSKLAHKYPTQRVGFVENGTHHHFIECSLFSPW